MGIETAAAILTKLAFEQNNDLKSKLGNAKADQNTLAELIMPLFRLILAQMEDDHQTRDKFPSAIAT